MIGMLAYLTACCLQTESARGRGASVALTCMRHATCAPLGTATHAPAWMEPRVISITASGRATKYVRRGLSQRLALLSVLDQTTNAESGGRSRSRADVRELARRRRRSYAGQARRGRRAGPRPRTGRRRPQAVLVAVRRAASELARRRADKVTTGFAAFAAGRRGSAATKERAVGGLRRSRSRRGRRGRRASELARRRADRGRMRTSRRRRGPSSRVRGRRSGRRSRSRSLVIAQTRAPRSSRGDGQPRARAPRTRRGSAATGAGRRRPAEPFSAGKYRRASAAREARAP